MPSPLITTKLYIPKPRQGLISRPVLLQCLSEGLAGKLTLISASSGYGKTTLMAEWYTERGHDTPIAWVSLDNGDNDPVRFLSYLIAALQNVQDGLGQDVSTVLQGSQNPLDPAILSLLINELSTVPNDFALVLEDYHEIEMRELHQMMVFILEHLPPKMHLVILTRSDPPFPLARLRARGELKEIRAKDLRFSLDDATSLFRDMVGMNLSEEHVRILTNRTEGWVTGLQLAALSIQGQENPSELVSAFGSGQGYIVDYLIEEVLNRQTKSLKLFLLQTSILHRLNGSLCNALTGLSDGEDTLDWLMEANLFVSSLGGEYRWYRYHRLFADVMYNRLQRLYPEQIPDLYLQAAKWFEQNNLITEAVEYALSADDLELASRLVKSNSGDLLRNGNIPTLLGWFKKLPEEIIKESPHLSIDRAWALLLAGNNDHIENYIAAAEDRAKTLNQFNELRGDFAAIRAYAASRKGDMEQAKDQAHKALEWLSKDDLTLHSVMAFVLGGIYYMHEDIPNALAAMQEASKAGEQAGNINVAVSALSAVGGLLVRQGKLVEAEKTYDRALKLGTGRSGQRLPIVSSVYAGLARLHLARKDFITARQFAQTGIELGEQWFNVDSQLGGYLTLAQVAHLEGNSNEAQSMLEKAKQLFATHTLTPDVSQHIADCEAFLHTSLSDHDTQGTMIDPLSVRELEVLSLFAEGFSNQEVAEKLIISLGTVKAHSSNIYRKLNVRNRAQAVISARELELF